MPAAAARWIVPAAVTALVVGGGVAASAASDAVPELPERSAADLLVAVGEAEPVPFSGTVRTVADLGLPSLGDLPGAASSETATDPMSALVRLATGENSLRVWVGGPEQQRVSLLDDFSELDVVRDGDVAWTYSSAEDTATRYDLAGFADRAEAAAAEHAAAHGGGVLMAPPSEPAPPEPALPEGASPADMTPDEIARTLLEDADETTEVTVGEAQVVAGRDAYTLVATPRDDATLVAGIEVAVDAATGLVLQVQVDARDQEAPAFVTGFTDLDLTAPDAEVFAFTPPAGTTVVDALAELDREVAEAPATQAPAEPFDTGALEEMFADAPEPVVHGEGWSTVVELSAPAGAPSLGGAVAPADPEDAPSADVSGEDASPFGREDGAAAPEDVDPAELLGELTTEVEGGQVFTSALLTVLLTDDGRLFVGPVDAETLQGYAG